MAEEVEAPAEVVECLECHGSGEVDCDDCDGTGEDCPHCGRGDCGACEGTGRVDCDCNDDA